MLPVGVIPRFLYSAFAIVLAFTLVAAPPVGQGLAHDAAYDRQGMNPIRSRRVGVPWRWASLDRWAARIQTWWPGPPNTVGGLLIGLHERAGSTDPPDLLAAAAASHVRWGAAM